MHWLFNEFKYKCNDNQNMYSFYLSQNHFDLPLIKDISKTKELFEKNPVLNLNMKNSRLNDFTSINFLDQTKFLPSTQSVSLRIETSTGKTMMVTVNPYITTVVELKLKILIKKNGNIKLKKKLILLLIMDFVI